MHLMKPAIFFKTYFLIYTMSHFPKKKIEVKSKYFSTPSITKGIRKSSKLKQQLYEKHRKIDQKRMKKLTKHITTYSRKLKKNAKKNCYRDKIKLFENDIRNTGKIMKEIIGKKKRNNETLPKHLIVDKTEMHDARSFAETFNEFLVNIGTNLANKIPQCHLTFKPYLPVVNITLNDTELSEDEFEKEFKSLKNNKAPGHDGLDLIIITSAYELIKKSLLKFFDKS